MNSKIVEELLCWQVIFLDLNFPLFFFFYLKKTGQEIYEIFNNFGVEILSMEEKFCRYESLR